MPKEFGTTMNNLPIGTVVYCRRANRYGIVVRYVTAVHVIIYFGRSNRDEFWENGIDDNVGIRHYKQVRIVAPC
jgi:hypothetical protein